MKTWGILVPILILSGFSAPRCGATVYHSDGSAINVQLIHDIQAIDGDTITIPAGTFHWATRVTINKAIILQGAGASSTNIISDVVTILDISHSARVTAITWHIGTANAPNIPMISMSAPGVCRIDHCTFTNDMGGNYTAITAWHSLGLIDHCTFGHQTSIVCYGDSGATWAAASPIGTSNNLFVEDCSFNYSSMADGFLDGYKAGHMVIRYCTINKTQFGVHGADSGGDASFRGSRSWEFYNNVVTNSGTAIFCVFNPRSGSGVIFNNTVTGNWNTFVNLQNYRSDSAYHSYWGVCDGSNPNDQNTPGFQGWACLDQIGRGTNQSSDPAYAWNNTMNGVQVTSLSVDGSSRWRTLHCIEGRDFFSNSVRPGYTPYEYPHPLRTSLPPRSGTVRATPSSPHHVEKEKKAKKIKRWKWGKAKEGSTNEMSGPR